ncbi:alpha/beta hydrolase family esterase [Rhodoferax sp.]|uniref:extracellular catalytic domain type 1 short-chain-length polyhydroxyalkanoate depolymerase n=1 Tax=Rhodoferax sp. TaxID=50421 RepID=UPI00374DE9F4
MSALFKKFMQEASRLTQVGHLQEATQAIQQALGRLAGTDAANTAHAANTANTATPQPTAAPWAADASVIDVVAKVVNEPTSPVAEPANPVAEPFAPAAPAADDGPGEFSAGRFSHTGGTHSYKLYTPPGTDTSPVRRLPLVLMLHGCTQNPDDFAAGTGMNALAREHGFMVLYPEQDASANSHRCWNWFKPGDQQRDSGEPAWLAALVRQVMADHPVDPRQVFVAGLSAGGAMASILGQSYPDLFAAVGVHSGLASGVASNIISALSVMKNGRGQPGAASLLPTIVFHGDADSTVHPDNGEAVLQSVLGQAVQSTAHTEEGHSPQGQRYTRSSYSQAGSERSIAEYWKLHGAGHAWAGGNSAGSYTDPQGPDASAEMWRFFQAHPREILH